SKEVEQALDLMQKVGLIYRYEIDGKKYLCVNPESFYRHQSYIQQKKRKDDSGSRYPRPDGPRGEYFSKGAGTPSGDDGNEQQETPQITAEQQRTEMNTAKCRTSPQNTASPSPSPSPSPSVNSRGGEDIRTREGKLFKFFEENFLLSPNSVQIERLGTYLD